VEFIREKYWQYDYEEVVTPNIYNFDLWKISGHADHYRWGGVGGACRPAGSLASWARMALHRCLCLSVARAIRHF
jgi:hypothetical protein